MTYAGLVKRAKSHFENCNNGPEETPVQGDCSYILTPRATGAGRPLAAGPECKNCGTQNKSCRSSSNLYMNFVSMNKYSINSDKQVNRGLSNEDSS